MTVGNATCASLIVLILATGCGTAKDEPPSHGTQPEPLTYWDDMAPLFADHCTSCHQAGGIAPFRLDDYASAKSHAALIAKATKERSMPPWSATSDGSCQSFSDSLALSDEQIADIGRWVDAGAAEGEQRSVALPAVPTLDRAIDYVTPKFVPRAVGSDLAEHDEYRCFLLDPGVSEPSFITAYETLPGAPEIVHHALLMVVDPNAPAGSPEQPLGTNLEQIQALHAQSPDRDGWPCFGAGGDGVNVSSVPVVWAPGQGVVEYPAASGVPIGPDDKVIVQIHYNLADAQPREDQTRIRLRLATAVENVAVFALPDPFLDTLFRSEPDTLPPGKTSTKYTWKRSMQELGVADLPAAVTLRGVMPHMHQRGHKFRMNILGGVSDSCAIDVQAWDFHWQRMYFYDDPIALDRDSSIEVTCDYDTSGVASPVLPGWGTQNEMCLATLFLTVPFSSLR